MTKAELLALAASGGVTIEVACTITRYCVTPKDTGTIKDAGYHAIFFSISDEDGSVYDDDAYFTDGDDEIELTDDEVGALANLVSSKSR